MTIKMTAENQVVEKKESTRLHPRAYKQAGAFTLTAILFAAKDRENPDQPIKLSNAWLPLASQTQSTKGAAAYTHPNVIPALSDHRRFLSLAPRIDLFAQEMDWHVQPVTFFYRPKLLNDYIPEGETLRELPSKMRQLPVDERLFIDISMQMESNETFDEARKICIDALKDADIKPPRHANAANSRLALSSMIEQYPFLVHTIFAHHPNLRVLRHRANVLGRDAIINHILYDTDEVFDPDTMRFSREPKFPIDL